LVARFTVFLGLAALTEAGLFFVIERALEVFFVEGEELFDLSLGDLLATFGLALVDELFLVDLDWRLDGMVPPNWKMIDPGHEEISIALGNDRFEVEVWKTRYKTPEVIQSRIVLFLRG